MAKKYIVDLDEDEVSQLQSIIKKGKHKARTISRANILLMASEGEMDQAMPTAGYAYADTVRAHIATVQRIREKFVVGGLDFALKDEAHPPKPKKLDETQVAFLIATACSNPPSGRVRWTMQLLADHLVSVGIVDSISDETVRQTLKKMKLNPG
jgi:transposase